MDVIERTGAQSASALYRALWRWHFYAGLVCLPFLVLMALTGALYLFRDEIDAIVYRDLLQVQPRAGAHLSPEAIVAAAVAAVPGTATRYVPPPSDARSAEVGITPASGQAGSVYVDPVTGQVLGRLADDAKLMEVTRRLHSLAIAGTVANYWIEGVAGWAIVLVVTGTCLWWPRGQPGGVTTVRGSPERRVWWRDLHAVTGAGAGAVILFLAVTGMPWSAFWGEQFSRFTNAWGIGLPEYVWGQAPQSDMPMAQLGDVPWTLQQAPVPLSSTGSAPAHHAAPLAAAQTRPRPIGLNAAIGTLDRLGLARGYSVSLPADERGVYTAMLFPDDVRQERVIHLDQYSGKPLIDIGYADYGWAGKATEWGIGLHTGRQFGLINKLLMLTGCLAIVALATTATVMWWKRRPAGRLAAPARQDGDRLARTVLVIAALLGLLYPLLGASMLAALALEAALPRGWRERHGL